MMAPRTSRPRRRVRAAAQDELARSKTRMHLLEVAGRIFGTQGFSRTTGKEICKAAGVNAAAINYHFGGIDALYAAVLREVANRIVSVDFLSAAVATSADPRAKLRALIAGFVSVITGPKSTSWEVRVLAREIISPTTSSTALPRKEIEQKIRIITSVIAEIMHLPPDSAAVAVAQVTVMAPCMLLLLADRARLKVMFPSLTVDPTSRNALTDHLFQAACAGIEHLARSATP